MSDLDDLADIVGGDEQIDLEEAIGAKAAAEVPASRKRGPGFGGMDPERRREVAAKGGSSVKAHNRSFARDKGLAARAGSLGGQKSNGGGRPRKAPV